jgi:hypothetical protein
MVRRRSTVRFRNGAPLKDQVRSSLDSPHSTLRMGAVAVLGGIWEIVSVSGPTELARSAREGEPGDARLRGGNRRLPCRRTGTRFQPRSCPAAIRTRDDGADRPGYHPATGIATGGSGTSFRDGLSWRTATVEAVPEMADSGIRAGSGAASGALPWRVVKSQSLGVTGIAGGPRRRPGHPGNVPGRIAWPPRQARLVVRVSRRAG